MGVDNPKRAADLRQAALTRREALQLGAALPLIPGAMTMIEQKSDTRASSDRPNILVLMTDDHGQWASHCYGNRELSTPNMDYLAETGARMRNAYTPCPVCSPARACFWTGRLPSQHGIHDWIREDGDARPWLARERPLASVLKAAGYHTGLAGKWHCGQGEIPKAGFDFALSHTTNQYPHRGVQHFTENGKPVAFSGQQSALVTSRALEFLRHREKDRPFFLFAGYVDTHSPFQDHPERLVQRYRNAQFVDIPRETYQGPCKPIHLPPKDEATQRKQLAQYYAAVTYVDEQIGVLLDELDASGDLANTLVVYTADHGHMNGHHGLYTKGNATAPQNFLEESIRIPCLLRWPGQIAPGTISAAPVDHCDLFQTVLAAAGVQEPDADAKRRNSPGKSYLPLLGNIVNARWRAEQFCEYGNARMIRTERHKYIVRYAPHAGRFPNELYDLQADPRETRNLISEAGSNDHIGDLQQRLDAHFTRYEEPESTGREILKRPFYNPNEPWKVV